MKFLIFVLCVIVRRMINDISTYIYYTEYLIQLIHIYVPMLYICLYCIGTYSTYTYYVISGRYLFKRNHFFFLKSLTFYSSSISHPHFLSDENNLIGPR